MTLNDFSDREIRLLEFATWRFMTDAYQRSNRLAKNKERNKESDLYWKDAKDAEEVVGKLREVIAERKRRQQPPGCDCEAARTEEHSDE